jgi:hypothetical protein
MNGQVEMQQPLECVQSAKVPTGIVNEKRCTKCGEEKPATPEFFHAYKRSSDGRRSVCKVCRAKDNADRNEEITAKKREYYAQNKDRLLAEHREYYARTVEKQRAWAIERHWKNRDRNLKRMQANWDENRDILNEKRRPGARERFHALYGNDLAFTLTRRVGALVRRTLRFNKKKDGKMKDILGFTVDELRQHIESQFTEGMSWDKFLSGEIHLDHKTPINFFKPQSVDDPAFKACWALSNLQPLWARDNLSKGYKIL